MYRDELLSYLNHKIRITLNDGKVLKGNFSYLEDSDQSWSGLSEIVINIHSGYLSVPISEIKYINIIE